MDEKIMETATALADRDYTVVFFIRSKLIRSISLYGEKPELVGLHGSRRNFGRGNKKS